MMRRTLIVLLVMVALLTACQEENPSEPSQLDAPFINATETVAATPWPTAWPTNTAFPTALPSPSPYPTRDRMSATLEPLDNVFTPGEWLDAPFDTAEGRTLTLRQFTGRTVVVHVLSSACATCIEQQQELLLAIQDRYEFQDLFDPVFIALGTEERLDPDDLRTALRSDIPAEQWATVELLAQPDVDADYYVASASGRLLAALERDFGPDVIVPERLAIIFIEPDTHAHLTDEGFTSFRDLRDFISYYGAIDRIFYDEEGFLVTPTPIPPTPTPTEIGADLWTETPTPEPAEDVDPLAEASATPEADAPDAEAGDAQGDAQSESGDGP